MRPLFLAANYFALVTSILTLAGCASVQVWSKTDSTRTEIGMASYYAHKFHGRPTASGEIYDESRLTAAHPVFPFGTLVRVTNLNNNQSVLLRVNDRGPTAKGRIIDVSFTAARELGFVRQGLCKVKVEVVKSD
jgi:rare lipoprotein A